MAYIELSGGKKLCGEIAVQGSKNAVLPIIAASVLHKGEFRIRHCPAIADVQAMLSVLTMAGGRAFFEGDTLVLNMRELTPFRIRKEDAAKTRASVLYLGALLGRFQEAELAYPGGCVIGKRPIDLHCMALEALGITLALTEEGICGKGRPNGGKIQFSFPSVGATENAILAAVLAKGRTQLYGAAREPEIGALCRFLNKAGARIRGYRSGTIVIDGVKELSDAEFTLPADRIVAGTYLTAAAGTAGEVTVFGTEKEDLEGFLPVLAATGAGIFLGDSFVTVKGADCIMPVKEVITEPFPGFPTDMQSQLMALLTVAGGDSMIKEEIFEARFLVAEELKKMGADIVLRDRYAVVHGVRKLHGMPVEARDLRGGAALVLAGLFAEGITTVSGYSYIARGYEDICRDFSALGASIKCREEEGT